MENIGAKLVRQAAARTNDTAGDGTTTATVLSAAFIAEGMKIVAAGTNPVQVGRALALRGCGRGHGTACTNMVARCSGGRAAEAELAPRHGGGGPWVSSLGKCC